MRVLSHCGKNSGTRSFQVTRVRMLNAGPLCLAVLLPPSHIFCAYAVTMVPLPSLSIKEK